MSRKYVALCLGVLFIGLAASAHGEAVTAGPVTEAVPASAVEKVEKAEKLAEPDLVLPGKRAGASTTQPAAASPAGSNWFDLVRVPLALVFVVGLILGMKWLVRRSGMGGAAASASSAGITVLSRTNLPPKQQVMLLKVGRRVLVTWSNGSEMGLLSEVADPEEVAELVGRIQESRSSSITQSFSSLFNKAEKGFEEVPADERLIDTSDEPAGEGKLGSDISGLRQQIQSLKERFKA